MRACMTISSYLSLSAVFGHSVESYESKALKSSPFLYAGDQLVVSNTTYTKPEVSDSSSTMAHV